MKNRNVAIISSNKDMARFLELELDAMDCSADVYATAVSVPDNYDLIIVDTDNVHTVSDRYAGRVLLISSDISAVHEPSDICVLPWPTSIERIRETCRRLMQNGYDTASSNTETASYKTDTVYVIDEKDHIVLVNNCKIKLSGTELLLLERLCSAKGETVSRSELMRLLDADDGNISDVYICHLRRKIEGQLGKKLIFTERKRGYRTSLVFTK